MPVLAGHQIRLAKQSAGVRTDGRRGTSEAGHPGGVTGSAHTGAVVGAVPSPGL
jgi:hypothetical protein